MTRPVVLLVGPHRGAMSGVSTHLNLLIGSSLAEQYDLVHVQVGSEGREESRPGRARRLLQSPFVVAAAVRRHRASIVHLNTSMNPKAYWRDLVYLFVARACGARVVYQVHGGELPEAFCRGSRLRTAWVRWTLGRPDVVVVLARAELAAYAAFVPGQHVVIIPNGVDVGPYEHLALPSPEAMGPLRLLYVGRVAAGKGLTETIEALQLAHRRGVEARLVVAGDGPEADRLRRDAGSRGLTAHVDFVGPVFGSDKVALLGDSDVLVLASYAEGLPYSLLEAMAAGRPVIATSVGAIPDVVTDGVHGRLVPPRSSRAVAEAVVSLAGDRPALAAMGAAARRRVLADFSLEHGAQELARQYTRLVTSRATPAPVLRG